MYPTKDDILYSANLCCTRNNLYNELGQLEGMYNRPIQSDEQIYKSLFDKYNLNGYGKLSGKQKFKLIKFPLLYYFYCFAVFIIIYIRVYTTDFLDLPTSEKIPFAVIAVILMLPFLFFPFSAIVFILHGIKKHKAIKEQNISIIMKDEYNDELLKRQKIMDEKPHWAKQIEEKRNDIASLEYVMEQKCCIHRKYWRVGKTLYNYIETGRAQSLSEAINIYEHDKQMNLMRREQEEMLSVQYDMIQNLRDEQARSNEIAQKQADALERIGNLEELEFWERHSRY